MSNYPSEEFLKWIVGYPFIETKEQFAEFMDKIREQWEYADSGYWEEIERGVTYHISTAGWSGNEDIIASLKKNFDFWSLFWTQTRKGGHYVFCSHQGLCDCGR